MKEILTGARKIASNVYNWLTDADEIYTINKVANKKDINALPRELDFIKFF